MASFRVSLSSADRISGAVNDGTYVLDLPSSIDASGDWMLACDYAYMQSASIPNAAQKITNFNVLGLPLVGSYGSQSRDSTVLLHFARDSTTSSCFRNVTSRTIGTRLSDLGPIRGRRLRIWLTDSANALNTDVPTIWTLSLVFYKHDD
jgi:hypothetical protein